MTRTARLAVGAALLLAAATGSYYFASPYITLHKVRSAAIAGDHRAVSDHIDFPAVRESVKGQVTAMMAKEMGSAEMKNNPFAAFGAALATAMIGPLVDQLVTPQAIAGALSRGQMGQDGKAKGAGKQDEQATPRDVQVEHRYDGLNRFIVNVRSAEPGAREPLEVVLVRQGLFHWRLTEIVLPTPR